MKDVAAWLRSLELEKFIPVFEEQEIDSATVRELTEEDLRELGLPMGPRKKLLRAIADLEAGSALPAPETAPDAPRQMAATPQGQSRQVTILFSDISGFTNLSNEIGAEDTHALLQTYFEVADEIVRQHGGLVDKHIGDSVMAVFGVPTAFGNEAQRAMNAALAIQSSMAEISAKVGRTVEVHIGLASGRVVADRVGTDARFTVIGESVNLAARLTDRAQAGQTIVSENVRASLPLDIGIGDKQTFTLKGFDTPVSAYVLTEQASDTVAETPIIGRAKEIAQFRLALAECLEAGMGQFVYARGEAGIGKTRLLKELERLAGLQQIACHRALVLDFGAAHRQDAIRALVRSLIGIGVNADKKARAAAAEALFQSNALKGDERVHLNSMLGLPQPEGLVALHDAMSPETRAAGQRQILFSLIEKAAADAPLLLIVEDIHWANLQTISTLAETVRRIAGLKVILVVTTRIEGDPIAELQKQGLGATSLTTLDLRRLRPEEAMQMASAFPDPSSDLLQLCIERSEGNPLFLEQLLRNASATGLSAVPDSVQSLVQASLDSLEQNDRKALEAAAIIGQRFHPDHVRQIMSDPDHDFSELVMRRLIQLEGDLYLFSHALVRDGVYASILRSRRRELHLRAGDILAPHDLSLRARHLEEAQSADAATAYLDAAHAAADEQDEEFALEMCLAGEALSPAAEVLLRLMLLRGRVLLTLGRTRQSIETFSAASALAASDTDRCRSLIGLAEGMRVANRNEEALETLERAEALSAAVTLSEQARIFHLRGSVLFTLGDRDGCLAAHNTSLDLAQQAGDVDSQATSLSGMGDAFYLQGLMIDARDRFDACVALCRENDLGRIEVANRHMIGWSRIHQLEFRDALGDAIANSEMAHRVANRRAEVLSLQLISFTRLRLGEFEGSEQAAQETIALADEIDAAVFMITGLAILAQAQQALGYLHEARASIARALKALKETGRNFVGPYVFAVAASLEEDPARCQQYLDEGQAILEEGCVIHNHPWFCEIAMLIDYRQGQWDRMKVRADALEAAFADQPLPRSSYTARTARALSDLGAGRTGPELRAEMEKLLAISRQAGLRPDTAFLSRALQALDQR